MEKLKNIHPGEVLLEEFLVPFNISAYKLSKDIDIPQTRVSQIIKGNRRITADTALRLSKYFGNSAKFWLGLQDDFDLEEEQRQHGKATQLIKRLEESVKRLNEAVEKHIAKKSKDPFIKDITDWKNSSVTIVPGSKAASQSKSQSSKKDIARSHK
jgi:addiction module HigA family antidote